MISNDFLRTMSRYNRWQNASLFTAADGLSEAERRADRGAFWRSIHGTLTHIYWGDRMWLSRFHLTEPPGVPVKESADLAPDWGELQRLRRELDDRLVAWCDDYAAGPVDGSLKWFSGAAQKDMEAPLGVIFVHFFNHQTHHRGQAHALITAAGARPEDTDLFLMPKALWP